MYFFEWVIRAAVDQDWVEMQMFMGFSFLSFWKTLALCNKYKAYKQSFLACATISHNMQIYANAFCWSFRGNHYVCA